MNQHQPQSPPTVSSLVVGNKLDIPAQTFLLDYNSFTRLIDSRLESMKIALYKLAKEEYKAREKARANVRQ